MRAMMTAICCDRIPTLSGPTRCWCHNWVSAINGHITSLSCREISVNDKKKLDWEWKYGRGAYLSCANACGDNNKNKHSKWREVSHNNVPVIITWQFKIPKQKFPIYQQCTIRRWNKRKTTPNMHTLQLPHTPRRTEKKNASLGLTTSNDRSRAADCLSMLYSICRRTNAATNISLGVT